MSGEQTTDYDEWDAQKATDSEIRTYFRQACDVHREACEALNRAERRVNAFDAEMRKRGLMA